MGQNRALLAGLSLLAPRVTWRPSLPPWAGPAAAGVLLATSWWVPAQA